MMFRVGGEKESTAEHQDSSEIFQYQQQGRRATEGEESSSSLIARGTIDQGVAEKEASEETATPPLTAEEISLLDQEHQTLLAAAKFKNDAAEKAEAELIDYHEHLNAKQELAAFQEPIETAVITAEEALSAWFSLASLGKKYITLSPSDYVVVLGNSFLPAIENSIRSWQVRLSHYELLQAEYEAVLLLQKINQAKRNQASETFCHKMKRFLDQRKGKIDEIHRTIASLATLYREGHDQAPINAQAWWHSRLEECYSRNTFWEIHLLKNQVLQRELVRNATQKAAFLFLNNERVKLSNRRDAASAIGFSKKTTQKIQQEKEAWSSLEQACIEIKQNHPNTFSDNLETELSIAQEKQIILGAREQEQQSKQKSINAEFSYGVALEALRTYHIQDPLQKVNFEKAQQTAMARQKDWDNLNQFCQASTPLSKHLKEEWDSLISSIQEETARSKWSYFDFKKTAAVVSAELYEERMPYSVSPAIFYTNLIHHGEQIIAEHEALSIICQNRLAILPKPTTEDSEHSTSRAWWQQQYDEIEEQKTSWLLDMAKWEAKLNSLKKT